MVFVQVLRDALRAKIAEHFELLLTTVGVMVAITLTFSQLDRGTQGLAFTFLVWLQGFLLWAVRRHSRFSRARLIRKLRVMLQDRVNNQVTVLRRRGRASRQRGGRPRGRGRRDGADRRPRGVPRAGKSFAGVAPAWESRYARFLPTPLR